MVKVDSKGRILVPLAIRDVVKLREGAYVTLVADPERREITIVPLADPSVRVAELRIEMPDVPGSLATIAKLLADVNIDLLASESRTLERGKLAEWRIIADVSKSGHSLKEIGKKLKEKGKARKIEAKLLG